MGLASIVLAAAISLNSAPAQPYTPPQAEAHTQHAYLRDEDQIGYEWCGLKQVGTTTDGTLPPPSSRHARQAYGTRRMGAMGYERTSQLPNTEL